VVWRSLNKEGVDEAEARRLLKLNGKTVTVTGKITAEGSRFHIGNQNIRGPYLTLKLEETFIDGVDQPKQ
jgi:hypothetical protein